MLAQSLVKARRSGQTCLHRGWLAGEPERVLVSAERGTLPSEFVSGSCRLQPEQVSTAVDSMS